VRVAIVCEWFFWQDGSRLGVGGVETYIQSLVRLLCHDGIEIQIFQRGTKKFTKTWNSCVVHSWRNFNEQVTLIKQFHGGASGYTIYSDFHVVAEVTFRPCVVVQHGVYWDVPFRRFGTSKLQSLLNLKKSLMPILLSRHILNLTARVDRVITVDTNFQNWMRTMCGWANLEEKWTYVPNYAEPSSQKRIDEKLDRTGPIRRVLFARRFEEFRGTFLWANVVKRIAPAFPDIEFCFCGHGQGKGFEVRLERELKDILNAKIYERPYELMEEEHYAADIEVVPSCASEGTSFSLIEAMASGACVVASNVGGLSNLILDGYNGFLRQPTEVQMETQVVSLIRNPDRVRQVARKGYETVVTSFSHTVWEERIRGVLEETFNIRSREN
jgi:glycosyltransferase involved in cell wall biosynthesis